MSQKSSTTELALERSHMENAMWAPGGTWALLQPSERGGWSGEVQVPSWHPVCARHKVTEMRRVPGLIRKMEWKKITVLCHHTVTGQLRGTRAEASQRRSFYWVRAREGQGRWSCRGSGRDRRWVASHARRGTEEERAGVYQEPQNTSPGQGGTVSACRGV